MDKRTLQTNSTAVQMLRNLRDRHTNDAMYVSDLEALVVVATIHAKRNLAAFHSVRIPAETLTEVGERAAAFLKAMSGE